MISIVIPIYNVEKHLEKCLDSVLNQTYKNIELILADDGSTDRSGEICDRYAAKDSRIKIIHKANGGVCSARNAAFKYVTGDYITFIDSDDYIDSNTYSEIMEYMNEKNADACFFGWTREYESGKTSGFVKRKDGVGDASDAVKQILKINNGYAGQIWNKVFSTENWKKNGVIEIPEMNTAYAVGEDCEWLMRMMKPYKKVAYTSKSYYHYIIRSDSAINIESFTKARLSEIYAREAVAEQAKKFWPEAVKLAQGKAYIRLIKNASLAVKIGDKNALKEIRTHIMGNRKSYYGLNEISKKEKIKTRATETMINDYLFRNIFRFACGKKKSGV